MENTQNNMSVDSNSAVYNTKKVLMIIVTTVAVVGALMWWMKQAPEVVNEAQVSPTPDAESAAINQDVNSIDVGDLNAEFNAIDKDLQGL